MIVDHISKILIVSKILNLTTGALIRELGMIFRSDNGPYCASQKFQAYMQEMRIKHRTSSPHYPQSNGLAKSMVKVSKDLMEKANVQKKLCFYYITEKQSTLISAMISSPVEIIFGCKMRSNLTVLPTQLMNDRIIYIREWITKKKER